MSSPSQAHFRGGTLNMTNSSCHSCLEILYEIITFEKRKAQCQSALKHCGQNVLCLLKINKQ